MNKIFIFLFIFVFLACTQQTPAKKVEIKNPTINSADFPVTRNDSEGNFTVTLNITNNVIIDNVFVNVNGNNPTVIQENDEYKFTIQQVWLNLGVNTVTVTATDSSGTQTTKDYTVTRVDDVNPSISTFTRYNSSMHDGLVIYGGNSSNHLYVKAINGVPKPEGAQILTEYYLTFSAGDNDQLGTPTTNIGSISNLGNGNYRVNFPVQNDGTYTLIVTISDLSGNSVSRSYNYIVEGLDVHLGV